MIRGDNHLVLDNLRDDYPQLVQWVREHGQPVKPRGMLSYELRNLSLTLLDPIDSLPLGVGRKLNLAIAAAEALQLISGVSDPALMRRIQPRFANFMDGSALHGSYGPRIRWQMDDVMKLLQIDSFSRQAIATIWDPSYDRSVPEPPRDLPCTLNFQFFWREGKLEMHTNMRSNDVVLGVSYDLFQFAQLQLTVARFLNTEVGAYHHHVGSFHLYASDTGVLDHLHKTTVLTRPEDLPTGFGDGGAQSWQEVADRARFVLDVGAGRITEGVNINAFSESEKWYLNQLRPYWVSGG
jgi:thymidylate synthase